MNKISILILIMTIFVFSKMDHHSSSNHIKAHISKDFTCLDLNQNQKE